MKKQIAITVLCGIFLAGTAKAQSDTITVQIYRTGIGWFGIPVYIDDTKAFSISNNHVAMFHLKRGDHHRIYVHSGPLTTDTINIDQTSPDERVLHLSYTVPKLYGPMNPAKLTLTESSTIPEDSKPQTIQLP